MFEPLPLVLEAPTDRASVIDAAERAARDWSLPDPRLVRVGTNAVFECGDVVLRVSRATAPMGHALRFAERIASAGVRVAMPARRDWIDAAGGLSVTAWQRIVAVPDATVDWERVGRMVAAVHAIDPSTVDHPLPYCGDFPWWRADLARAELLDDRIDPAARAGMQAAIAEHGWWLEHCRQQLPTLCHGDVHPGNVLVDDEGPVLIDWDLLCIGPPEWDHSAMLTWNRRWGGAPGIEEAFAAGYAAVGGRHLDARVAVAIAEMRLLVATLMRLRRARADPSAAPEAERRLLYWSGDPEAPAWLPQ